jgi:hypothetical protein
MAGESRLHLKATKGYTYWVGSGSMYGLTRKETMDRIHKAMREKSRVANWNWTYTTDKAKASVRIYIAGNDHHRLQSWKDGKLYYIFGRGSTDGWVYINKDRKVNFKSNPVLEWLVKHEVWHTQFGSAHRNTVGCVMHPGQWTDEYCPAEIRFLKSRVGSPKKPFYPEDRSRVGREIRSLKDSIDADKTSWQRLVDKRTASIKAGTWLEDQKDIQPKIKVLVDKMRQKWAAVKVLNMDWHEVNRKWVGVPGVVQVG